MFDLPMTVRITTTNNFTKTHTVVTAIYDEHGLPIALITDRKTCINWMNILYIEQPQIGVINGPDYHQG